MVISSFQILLLVLLTSCGNESKTTYRSLDKKINDSAIVEKAGSENREKSPGAADQIQADDQGDGKSPNEDDDDVADNTTFKLSPAVPVIQNLGTTQTYEYTISSKDYSDSLSFAVDRSMMDPLDPQNNIKISVEPEDLVITDQDQIIKVNVQVETLSPSFSQSDVKFTLIGLAGDQKIATKLDIPVQVNPIFEITMEGSNNVVYSPNLTEYSFRPHQNGLKIIYKKPDTANIVHGNGIIPHQRIATPSPDYEVTIMPNVANCTGSFYSHNNEGGGNARRVRCNVQ